VVTDTECARALLRHPTLLVLDEATSSLDDETEMAVLNTIAGLTPAVTVLVVAHRRTTLDLADHVIRINQGRRVTATGQ
jgi:ABC-type multidrug transport system fused ATPase/permease subunit